jgi:hypothetical protein
VPPLIPHVDDYREDLPRLGRYASQVINARIRQFGFTTLHKTYYFLEMYLQGNSGRNIYQMVFASRALIEVYAVTADTFRVIVKNSGDQPDELAKRAKEIDEAIIKSTYGTRSDNVRSVFKEIAASKLRAATDEDKAIIEAKNILTRIDRSSRLEEYPDCRSDYDRLSEYVHPNIGQNVIIAWPRHSRTKFV